MTVGHTHQERPGGCGKGVNLVYPYVQVDTLSGPKPSPYPAQDSRREG